MTRLALLPTALVLPLLAACEPPERAAYEPPAADTWSDDGDWTDDASPDDETPVYWMQRASLHGDLPTVGTLDDEARGDVYVDAWMLDLDLEVEHDDGTFAMLLGSAALDAPLEPGTSSAIDPSGLLGCSGQDGRFDFDEAPVDAVATLTPHGDGQVELEVVVDFEGIGQLIGVAVLQDPG
jgi:hypothetical protein